MKRILVFDHSCSLCAGIARKVCNEAGDLIHDVWSLADSRTKEILGAAGLAGLSRPAVIEITPEKTSVIAGPKLQWRLLRMLGPQRALRLAKVIAGDLAAASLGPVGKAPQSEVSRPAVGAVLEREAKVPSVVDRRGFLGLVTNVAAVFVVVTGLGYSKLARAQAKRRKVPNDHLDKLDIFSFRWTQNLEYEPGKRNIAVEQGRELRWEQFKELTNVRRLLSSREFEAHPGAVGIRQALLSAAVPPDLSKDLRVDQVPSVFMALQSQLKNGSKLNVDVLMSGTLAIKALELRDGARRLRSGIKLYEVDYSTYKKKVTVLSSYSRGAPDFNHPKFRFHGGA